MNVKEKTFRRFGRFYHACNILCVLALILLLPVCFALITPLRGPERAIAQPAGVPGLYLTSPTGNEQINVLGLGPQIETVTINQIRNAAGYTLVPTGTTVTTNVPNTSSIVLATGAITTWNVNFPTAPFDGLTLKIGCPGGNVGTLTAAATLPMGVAITGASFTACTEATPTDAAWIYAASANVWYRTE